MYFLERKKNKILVTAQKKLRVLMESMVMKIWHFSRIPMNAPLTRDMNQENNEHYDAGRQSLLAMSPYSGRASGKRF